MYFGEADVLSKRIASHDKDDDKDFFTRVVLIASADANVTKAHARCLETRLIETVKDSNRATRELRKPASPGWWETGWCVKLAGVRWSEVTLL